MTVFCCSVSTQAVGYVAVLNAYNRLLHALRRSTILHTRAGGWQRNYI